MFNIYSYTFYNLSNLLFLFLIPNNFTKLFLINYSIASGVFTFLIFYHFSKKNFFSEKTIMIIITIILIFSELYFSKVFIIWFFTFFLIYSDYFFSQRKNYLLNLVFKFILMMSSLLLYNGFLNPMDVLRIKLFLIYITFIIYYLFCRNEKFLPLKVNSPILYNLWTCIIYFLSLFLLTILIQEDFIKIIYISFQILIGMQLKLFDLKIRNINVKYFNFEYLFVILSFIYLFILGIFTSLYFIVIFYLIIFLGLNLIKKKYIT